MQNYDIKIMIKFFYILAWTSQNHRTFRFAFKICWVFSLFPFSLRFDGCMHIWVLHAPYMKGVGFINSDGFPQGRPMFLLVFFSKIVILKST